jgi:hypothetical protein
MNVSSPPSIGEERNGLGIDAAHGVFDGDNARHVGQAPQGIRREVLSSPIRDVVDDQRDGAGGGELREVCDHPGLARTRERRDQAQRRHDFRPAPQRVQRLATVGSDD